MEPTSLRFASAGLSSRVSFENDPGSGLRLRPLLPLAADSDAGDGAASCRSHSPPNSVTDLQVLESAIEEERWARTAEFSFLRSKMERLEVAAQSQHDILAIRLRGLEHAITRCILDSKDTRETPERMRENTNINIVHTRSKPDYQSWQAVSARKSSPPDEPLRTPVKLETSSTRDSNTRVRSRHSQQIGTLSVSSCKSEGTLAITPSPPTTSLDSPMDTALAALQGRIDLLRTRVPTPGSEHSQGSSLAEKLLRSLEEVREAHSRSDRYFATPGAR